MEHTAIINELDEIIAGARETIKKAARLKDNLLRVDAEAPAGGKKKKVPVVPLVAKRNRSLIKNGALRVS
jgi:hypothetical protein